METGKSNENFYTSLNKNLEQFYYVEKNAPERHESEQAYSISRELQDSSDRYIDRVLFAEGGMKLIYRVTDSFTNRAVAMAVLKEDTKDAREQFLREARLTSSLQHPNIIPIYDVGLSTDKTPFFTMELMEGSSLQKIITKLSTGDTEICRCYPQTTMIDIFIRICDAMAYAHSKGVLHLDLKPENVQIGMFGEVRICDWGLSKAITRGVDIMVPLANSDLLTNATIDGIVKGTPGFMSPEQVNGFTEKTSQTDIYSLGAVLYSLVTYQAPISGGSVSEILGKTRSGMIQKPRDINPTVSRRLETLIMKCLELNPEQRYHSVNELRAELDKYKLGYAIDAESAGFLTHLLLLYKRHRIITTTLILSIGITILTTSLAFDRISKQKDQAIHAQIQAEKNLDMYTEEHAKTIGLNKQLKLLLMDLALNGDYAHPNQRIKLLDDGLKSEIDQNKKAALWNKKGIHHFILEEFTQAQNCFREAGRATRNNVLYKLSAEYKTKPDNEIVSFSQLAQLLTQLRRNLSEIGVALYENHMKHINKSEVNAQDYFSVVPPMLNILSGVWNESGRQITAADLTLSESRRHLNLSNTSYKNFTTNANSSINILTPLKLSSLDLSQSAFSEFHQLPGKFLKRLNLAGCNVREFTASRCRALNKKGVKILTIDSERFTPEEQENLNTFFTIVKP